MYRFVTNVRLFCACSISSTIMFNMLHYTYVFLKPHEVEQVQSYNHTVRHIYKFILDTPVSLPYKG